MRRFLPLFAVFLAVSSCVNPITRADSTDTQCRLANPQFPDYAGCVHNAVARDSVLNSGPGVDLVNRYLAGVRLLSARVRAGEISNNLALLASADYYSALKDEYLGRQARSAAAAQRRSEFLGSMGLGLYQAGQPRPAPQTGVTCIQQGAVLVCN